MQNYALVARIYDKGEAPDWGIESSRVSGIYWNLDADYPLAIEFKNGDIYGYQVQHIQDARGKLLGSESWHVLTQLLTYHAKKGKVSIGGGINVLLKDCAYMKLGAA